LLLPIEARRFSLRRDRGSPLILLPLTLCRSLVMARQGRYGLTRADRSGGTLRRLLA